MLLNDKNTSNSSISIYIHWPFCKSKCHYCNFNSYPITSIDENQWLKAYLKELEIFKRALKGKVIKSIYFGGGTPSLMPIGIIEGLLRHINNITTVSKDTEITIEVNPTSGEQEKLRVFKEIGINRLSIGVQALNDFDLKVLGRTHSVKEALSTIELAQKIFDNYSFDLIYARPNQTLDGWAKELKQALKHIKHHISLYQLSIEQDTPFAAQYATGKLERLCQETEAQMFINNREILESNGIYQYEISNYAVRGKESIHNLAYWNYDEYIGIGPGAHSRIRLGKDVLAIANEMKPDLWIRRLERDFSAIVEKETLLKKQVVCEYVLMNLRKATGIITVDFYNKFGENVYKYFDHEVLDLFRENGWLRHDKESVVVTENGRLFLDRIIERLIEI